MSPPRFVSAPWQPTNAAAPLLTVSPDGAMKTQVERRAAAATPLGPFSPVFGSSWKRWVTNSQEVQLGTLVAAGEHWALKPDGADQHPLVNGLPVVKEVTFSHGDVLEVVSETQAHAWLVAFEGGEAKQLDTALGPLWFPFRRGVFTLEESDEPSRWQGVLRAGPYFPGRNSLEWLRAVLACDFARRLASLELHLWMREARWAWPDFVRAHRELASHAPFALLLRAPVDVLDTSRLPSLALSREPPESAGQLEALGVGTRWTRRWGGLARAQDFSLNGGSLQRMSEWVSLAEGDWVSPITEPERKFEVVATARARPTPSPRREPTPWAVLPRRTWEHFPLEESHGEWLLFLDGLVHRHLVTDEGVHPVGPDERPGPLVRWFERVPHPGYFVVPGRSMFLSGSKQLPREAPLSLATLRPFVEELSQCGDPAAPGLRALLEEAPDAGQWLGRLLTPYYKEPSALNFWGGIKPEQGEHCGGFFTALTLTPWIDFHLDVPVLLAHPLMPRLRHLELLGAVSEEIKAAVRRARPELELSTTTPTTSPLRLVRGGREP